MEALGATPAPWALTPDGLGPVRIGMSKAQAARALGTRLSVGMPADADNGMCEEAAADGYGGLYLMFETGRLTRLLISKAPADTPTANERVDLTRAASAQGVRLGMREAEVRRRFGGAIHAAVRPYEREPAHELTWIDRRSGRGFVFETDAEGRVEEMRAGRARAIAYAEGCD
jgi:hypothetical protein